jgi:hypothetical protein
MTFSTLSLVDVNRNATIAYCLFAADLRLLFSFVFQPVLFFLAAHVFSCNCLYYEEIFQFIRFCKFFLKSINKSCRNDKEMQPVFNIAVSGPYIFGAGAGCTTAKITSINKKYTWFYLCPSS